MKRSMNECAGGGEAQPHWIEVVDGLGLLPARLLGPYASAGQAERMRRGVLRLLNAERYAVAVRSPSDLAEGG